MSGDESRPEAPTPTIAESRDFDCDRLRARPQRETPQLSQVLGAGNDREKVVAGELAGHAGEVGAPVGEQDFRLADAARVEQYLARQGIADRVLERDVQGKVAERNPRRLT